MPTTTVLASALAQATTPAAAVQPPVPPADPFAPAPPLPAGVRRMTSPCGTSVVTVATKDALKHLGRVPGLRQPGAYMGLWHELKPGTTLGYVGLASENLLKRVQSSSDLRGRFEADEVVLITATDPHSLTDQDAAALERMVYDTLKAQGHAGLDGCPYVELLNRERPHGAPDHPDLAKVHLFCSGAALALKRLSILHTGTPDRDLITGPPSPVLRVARIPYQRGQVRLLAVPSLPVYAVPLHYGDYVVLEGSRIEAEAQPGISAEAKMLRVELLHAGVLVEDHGGRLRLTANVRLKSSAAAVAFAAGIATKQVSTEAWRPLAPEEHTPDEWNEVELIADDQDEPVPPEDDESQRGPGRR